MNKKRKTSAVQHELEFNLFKQVKNAIPLAQKFNKLQILSLGLLLTFLIGFFAGISFSQPSNSSMNSFEQKVAQNDFSVIEQLINIDYSVDPEAIKSQIWKNIPQAKVSFITSDFNAREMGVAVKNPMYFEEETKLLVRFDLGANNTTPVYTFTWSGLNERKLNILINGLKLNPFENYFMTQEPRSEKIAKNDTYNLTISLQEKNQIPSALPPKLPQALPLPLPSLPQPVSSKGLNNDNSIEKSIPASNFMIKVEKANDSQIYNKFNKESNVEKQLKIIAKEIPLSEKELEEQQKLAKELAKSLKEAQKSTPTVVPMK